MCTATKIVCTATSLQLRFIAMILLRSLVSTFFFMSYSAIFTEKECSRKPLALEYLKNNEMMSELLTKCFHLQILHLHRPNMIDKLPIFTVWTPSEHDIQIWSKIEVLYQFLTLSLVVQNDSSLVLVLLPKCCTAGGWLHFDSNSSQRID